MWRPQRFTDDEAAHAGVVARGRNNVIEAFATIEMILSDGRRWAVPDAYTVADAFLLVFHRWGSVIGLAMPEYPAWGDLSRRVLRRPAVASAFAKDGLHL